MMVREAAVLFLMLVMGAAATADPELGYRYVIEMTGISALLTIIPCFFLYRDDQSRREYGKVIRRSPDTQISVTDILLLLLLGAALSFYGNILLSFLSQFIDTGQYSAQMELIQSGKSMVTMVLWMGIVAPVAEEMVFRWLIYLRLRDHLGIGVSVLISSVFFGVYHGNVVQAIYASILGVFFAISLEMTGNLWSCILLHIGANVFSLMLEELALGLEQVDESAMGLFMLMMAGVLLACLIGGTLMIIRRGKSREYRAL